MPKRKPSTLDALAQHQEQQRALAEKGAALRRAAALELGDIVLDAGGAALGPEGVRRAIQLAADARSPKSGGGGHAGRTAATTAGERDHDAR